jgi:hypothetical protein
VITSERRCEHCSRLIPSSARTNKRYCCTAHRQAAYAARRRRARVELLSDVASSEKRSETLTRAAEHESPHLARLQAAVKAATDETRLVALVAAAAQSGSWRAAAWLLERRHPERWASRPRSDTFEFVPDPNDAFAEVDQLAERRKRRDGK